MYYFESLYYIENYRNITDLLPVRCMKDEQKPVSGSGNDLIVDDEYEW